MSRASRPGHSRPTAVIVIAPDESSAEIVIEGHRQVVSGLAPHETRRAALDVATGYAAHIGQPVLVDARDANGYWRLIATPDGVVQPAEPTAPAQPRPQPPVPGQVPAPQSQVKGKKSGRLLVVGGAIALVVLLLVGAGLAIPRILPGSSDAAEEGEADENAIPLEYPAPPGFEPVVELSEELAPDTQPAVSRDGSVVVYVDPEERLNLIDADGSRLWSVDLPFDAAAGLGAPRFVDYGGESTIVMETADTLWFWPESGGTATNVELPESGSARYAGDSVLVRDDDAAYLVIDGELEEIEAPGSSVPMLAADDRALTAVVSGPWNWISPGEEDPEVVHAERPSEAGEMEAVLTALREYVIVRWEPLQGDGSILAFHDREDGSVLGSAAIEEDALEDVSHLSAPIGLDLVVYGPVLFDPHSGETAVVPGFTPEISVGDQVFGELDGNRVALDTSGEPSEVPEDAETPRGLLGDRAVVVHDGHLYAIPPE
ncbi:hypothetical protein NE857_20255 [Nocardiopsis exhalans]|uniref:PQQ-like domain-containing protein n=1 Tax=Nocardiopsis exhalans TaxID=163604 RepID=A0ABY5D3D7_9ACTN|nr:hypothetical protein [Nocardiopsis exhalans]USY17664.1 hypothetical protein NE857_20255 [Nocardiopsis exhalans]